MNKFPVEFKRQILDPRLPGHQTRIEKTFTQIVSICEEVPVTAFVDVGCFLGYFARAWTERFPRTYYYGFDALPAYLDYARENCPGAFFSECVLTNMSQFQDQVKIDTKNLIDTSSMLRLVTAHYQEPVYLDVSTSLLTPEEFARNHHLILNGSYLKINIDNGDPILTLQIVEAGAKPAVLHFECWYMHREFLPYILKRLGGLGYHVNEFPVHLIAHNAHVILHEGGWKLITFKNVPNRPAEQVIYES